MSPILSAALLPRHSAGRDPLTPATATPGPSASQTLAGVWRGVAAALLAAASWWAATPVLASTVGSGRTATETRAVEGFEAVSLRGSIDLEVRQAAQASVAVTADDNLLPLLETVVDGGTLQVRFRRGESVRTKTPTKVVVTTPKLTAVSSAGSGDVLVDGLQTPVFKLSIAGSSETVLRRLQTDALEVTIAGSGDVKGDGSARALKISIAGSGDVLLGGVESDDVQVSIAGSGDAAVTANKSLRVSIAGSGDVSYRGNPTSVKSSVMGSGSLEKR